MVKQSNRWIDFLHGIETVIFNLKKRKKTNKCTKFFQQRSFPKEMKIISASTLIW